MTGSHQLTVSFGLAALLIGCRATISPAQTSSRNTQSAAFTAILDDVWIWRLSRNPMLRMQQGMPVETIPAETIDEANRSAGFARGIMARLDQLRKDGLNQDQQISGQAIRFEMEMLAAAPRYYWHSFSVTPYQSGFFAASTFPVFSRFQFSSGRDADHYLELVGEFASVVEQKLVKLKAQDVRGIRLPAPAIPAVVTLYADYATTVPKLVAVADDRLFALAESERNSFHTRLEALVQGRLVGAHQAIADFLNGDYLRRAPATVGVSHYPGGKAYYRYAIRRQTTLDLTPEEIRGVGLRRMDELRHKMAAVRRRVGFVGDQAAFHRHLKSDPRFVAPSAQALESIYHDCLRKIEPQIPKLFRELPKAPYGVKRLAPELEGGMTFGQYDQPHAVGDTGFYVYNGSGLSQKPTFTACALIYHELIPGHHFHVASQQENQRLHAVERTNYSFGAYNEGWGEYAASLGYETGAYDDPYSLYGRYLMESHVVARLIVDTGLNYYGWTIPRAEQYLREATLLTDQQVKSEVLRYSTDLPAQALSYGIGYDTFWRLRRKAEVALGNRFEVRDFHDAVLGHGAMPLSVLTARVDRYIAEQGTRRGSNR